MKEDKKWQPIIKNVEKDIDLWLKKGYIFFNQLVEHFSFSSDLGRDPTYLICKHYLTIYFQEI